MNRINEITQELKINDKNHKEVLEEKLLQIQELHQ
jgi:hypothetical protein